MLRTLPSPQAQRRRGGQPRNTNAFRHGFYAAHTLSPIQPDSRYFQLLNGSPRIFSRASCIPLLEQHLRDTCELLMDHFLATDDPHCQPDTIGKFERFFRTVSYELRLKRRLKKWRDEQDFLPNLAKNALSLAILEFTDPRVSVFAIYGANYCQCEEESSARRVAESRLSAAAQRLRRPHEPGEAGWSACSKSACPEREADKESCQPATALPFVPQLFSKNHTISTDGSLDFLAFEPENPVLPPLLSNAVSVVPQTIPGIIDYPVPSTENLLVSANHPPPNNEHSFPLTPSQASLLDPILASLRAQLEAMAIRVRKRTCSDRFLLQMILLRLAFNLRWSDLPPELPIRLCQAYYRYLCTSGRMQQIYRLLHADFCAHAGKNLLEMVDSGHFKYQNGRIYLAFGNPITWESLTGLLLLQRACFNQRRLKRAIAKKRGGNARYERPTAPRPARTPRRRPVRSAEPSDLISVFDCRSTNPILNSKLRHPPGKYPSGSP